MEAHCYVATQLKHSHPSMYVDIGYQKGCCHSFRFGLTIDFSAPKSYKTVTAIYKVISSQPLWQKDLTHESILIFA